MSTYTVTAKRWGKYWELHIENGDVGVTQSRNLGAAAERMIRDYLRLTDHADYADAEIIIIPELGTLSDRVAASREHLRAAGEATRKAAAESREVARALRDEGLSVTDTAAVLGVSRGRVSQLVS